MNSSAGSHFNNTFGVFLVLKLKGIVNPPPPPPKKNFCFLNLCSEDERRSQVVWNYMKVSNYWQNFHFWVNYPFNILWIEKLLVCKKQICHWISPNLFETHLSWMAWEWTNIIFLLLIMFKTNGFGLFAWDQCHFLVKSLEGNFYLFICLFVYLFIGIILLSFTLFYERKYHPGHSANIPYMWYDRDLWTIPLIFFWYLHCKNRYSPLVWSQQYSRFLLLHTHTFVTPVWSHTAAAGVCVYVYVFLYVWVP